MKKFIILISIIFFGIQLSSCTYIFHNYNFTIPDFDDYKIEQIEYIDQINHFSISYEDIEEEILSTTIKANIMVLNISYNAKNIFDTQEWSSGSGVIFYSNDDYYYALTNNHVVELYQGYNNQIIEIFDYDDNKYDGFIYEGSLNEEYDLAVVVFSKDSEALSTIDIKSKNPIIGSKVIAIGNPLDERNVITLGVVDYYNETSITDKYDEVKINDWKAIVYTARTDHGSSGCMVIDYTLQLVGVHFAGNEDGSDYNSYAIPVQIINEYLLNWVYVVN